MKNINKILFSILCSFLILTNVKASFSCDVKIDETGITPAEFNVTMPICVYPAEPTGFEEVTEQGGSGYLARRSTYTEAYNAGLELLDVVYTRETADAKSYDIVNGKVPFCSNNLRKVKAFSTCSVTKSAAHVNNCSVYSSDAGRCTNTSGCTYDNANSKCIGRFTTYYCDGQGWTYSNGRCNKTYDYEEEVSGNVTSNTIKSACQSATGGSCTCGTVEYGLICPYYTCQRENKEVGACTPDFEVDGLDAYCVNPSQGFPKTDGNNYQYDSSFNVRECANSYSTPECGYANILIEAAYHNKDGKISDDAINLALRLWSYRTNRGGFDKTGLANRTGDSCNTSVYYMADASGKKENVYANTHKYIMETAKEKFYDVAYEKSRNNGYLPDYIANPKEDKDNFTGDTFEKISCENTLGVTCGNNPSYRIAFELFFNTLIGNKYMIDHLDTLYNDEGEDVEAIDGGIMDNPDDPNEGMWIRVSYEKEDYEKAFGDEEVIKCDESDPKYIEHKDQIEKYCKKEFTTVWIVNGVKYYQTERPDACYKTFGCVKKTEMTKNEAVCRPETTGRMITEVWVKYTRPKSSMSIRRYISCGDTEENQEMFAYIPETIPGSQEDKTTEDKKFFINYKCDDACDNYKLRTEGEDTCSTENAESFKKTIKDPSLSCIVNMTSSAEKEVYDYSDYFGVNTNFCRIYCSDEVEYNIAGRTNTNSGLSFVYDVKESRSAFAQDYKFSAVVKEKRSCVSEIYFDNLPRSVNWKRIYGLTDDENDELMSNATWTKLFGIIAHKDTTGRVQRQENLNQMVFDLYNCNLYKKQIFDNRDLEVPSNNTVVNVYNKIVSTYSPTNNYGYSSGLDKFQDTIDYTGGANVADYDGTYEGAVLGRVGISPYNIKASSIFNDNSSVFGLSRIKYCADDTCLPYVKDNESYSYDRFTNRSTEDSELLYGYKIPTNRYAYFEVNTEVNFYNNEKYQVLPGSGNVILGDSRDNLHNLELYNYPVAKEAYTMCGGGSGSSASCPVTQNINISAFHRAKSIDNFKSTVEKQTFKCSVGVFPPEVVECNNCDKGSKSSSYRNVDPEKMFPSEVIPENWDTPEGQQAIKDIADNASRVMSNNPGELLEYSISLNPSQIKAIKSYNKNHSSETYMKESTYGCEKVVDEGKEIYLNCKNRFLDILRGSNAEYIDKNELGTLK